MAKGYIDAEFEIVSGPYGALEFRRRRKRTGVFQKLVLVVAVIVLLRVAVYFSAEAIAHYWPR